MALETAILSRKNAILRRIYLNFFFQRALCVFICYADGYVDISVAVGFWSSGFLHVKQSFLDVGIFGYKTFYMNG